MVVVAVDPLFRENFQREFCGGGLRNIMVKKISKRTFCNLVVLDDDVVGALGLFKLPGPRNAHRCQG